MKSSEFMQQFLPLNSFERSLEYTGPKSWNSIQIDIKNKPSLRSFRKKYKKNASRNILTSEI